MFDAFKKFRESSSVTSTALSDPNIPCIVVVDDDPEQAELLKTLIKLECESFFGNKDYSDQLCLVGAHSLASLKKVLSLHQSILHVVLDANIPDRKGEKAHDQFVKDKFKISGQHYAVDAILELKDTPAITLVSAMNRFQKIVTQYYAAHRNTRIEFIRKNEAQRIQVSVKRVLSAQFPS